MVISELQVAISEDESILILHIVRRVERGHGRGDRQDVSQAPTPGGVEVSARGREDCAQGARDSHRAGQLLDTQAREGAHLDRTQVVHFPSFHSDQHVLGQPCGAVLRHSHAEADSSWRVHIGASIGEVFTRVLAQLQRKPTPSGVDKVHRGDPLTSSVANKTTQRTTSRPETPTNDSSRSVLPDVRRSQYPLLPTSTVP